MRASTPTAVLAAVGGGAATSWQLTNLGAAHAARRLGAGIHGPPAAEGPAARARRGRRRSRVPLPATAVVHQLLAAVEARGGGDLGTQALAQALEALAGGAFLTRRSRVE